MKNLKLTLPGLITVALVIFLTSCEVSLFTREDPAPLKTRSVEPSHEGPGGYTDDGNGTRYPYPNIIKREYIPTYDLWAHTKCLAWRITWPTYGASAEDEKIPTAFATKNGALNSFYYLNNVDPQNTYNTNFSLYYEDKVISTNTMWAELDYADAVSGMETAYFALTDQPLDVIQHWVEDRPSQFKSYWPGSNANELDYQEGDIILYRLADADLYGGIRIVSLSPRTIEVYLAVPNI